MELEDVAGEKEVWASVLRVLLLQHILEVGVISLPTNKTSAISLEINL